MSLAVGEERGKYISSSDNTTNPYNESERVLGIVIYFGSEG